MRHLERYRSIERAAERVVQVARSTMDSRALETTCCIAGGGPAGIMLGYLLARAGVDVTVLEKWPDFFRDFRGDTIHPSTMEALHELGLLDAFLRLPHNKTRQITAYVGGEPIAMSDFSHLRVHCPFVALIPQWDFLNYLSAEAKQLPSFHLLMATSAEDVIRDGERIVGVRARDADGPLEIRARLVVAADGRHSTLRARARMPVRTLGAPIDVLWFRLAAHEHDPDQSLGYVDAGKLLVALDRGSYWQCGLVIEKGGFDRLRARGLEAFREDVARLAPFLAESVKELTSWDQVKLLSVAVDRARTWYKDGLLLIGDAAHAMSPIGGVGINLAIQDAIAAANVLVPALRRGGPTTDDLAAIQRRRELPTRVTQRIQIAIQNRIVAPVLRSRGPIKASWSIRLFNRVPALRRIPGRLIGIGIRPEHVATA